MIHEEIEGTRTDHVRGVDLFVEACDDLFRARLRCLVKIERSKVMSAAKKVARGKNFVEWVEGFYCDQQKVFASDASVALACYRKGRDVASGRECEIADMLCKSHSDSLLSAADGDRNGFIDRVQSALDTWDAEIDTITCEG